jgi:hypothetical protein
MYGDSSGSDVKSRRDFTSERSVTSGGRYAPETSEAKMNLYNNVLDIANPLLFRSAINVLTSHYYGLY